MLKGLVIDYQGGVASVMLDDDEIINIRTSEPVCMGDEIPVSGDMIEAGDHPNIYDDEEEDQEALY